MKPDYAPNVVNQTVEYGGVTWKGQPGGDWVQQSGGGSAPSSGGGYSPAINMPSNSGTMPGKADINPATGKAYAVNPATGVWDDNFWANTVEPQLKAQYGGSSGGGTGLSFNQPTIDLPKLYQGLYASSGISDIERGLSDKTNAYNEQIGKIKDNPHLSEATMTGRISKLTDKFNADKANIQNDIAMRKADVETQLNLQTKQFDINSQQAQNAFNQFQSLLSAGALDNASGEDIANLTRSTGLSSSMIQSAIGVSQKKNAPKVNTQVIQVDDGTNVSAVVIDQDTGEVINKQVIGASTPTAAEQKAASGGGGTSDAVQIKADKAAAPSAAARDAANKMTLGTLMKLYSQYGLSNQQIYDIYLANTSYKQNEGTIKNDTTKYNVKHK